MEEIIFGLTKWIPISFYNVLFFTVFFFGQGRRIKFVLVTLAFAGSAVYAMKFGYYLGHGNKLLYPFVIEQEPKLVLYIITFFFWGILFVTQLNYRQPSKPQKVFSFDAETNGLWGQPFAIGAIIYNEEGVETARFVGRCPIVGEVDRWVEENVLPQIIDISESYENYEALLVDFAQFYLTHQKDDVDVLVHMGYVIEARIFRDMHDRGLIGDWQAPYPLHDVSGNLQAAGEDPTSVGKYLAKKRLNAGSFAGGFHNPLYDCAAAAVAYRHLQGW
ncbi:hypothetical protein HYV70_05120 [Candidatus Uhrbacteria bacterium]|nr:hypothetical protein [Candidatus Uhrbacteria bacterium]